MTASPAPSVLTELRTPSSPAAQVAALRALKNELIGHEQKKEMWVGLGVVPSMVRILNTHKAGSKKRYREGTSAPGTKQRADDEEARLQAIIIIGSLAQGGPAFVSPLQAASTFAPLLTILCPGESAPLLVLAALRALNSIADSVALDYTGDENDSNGFLASFYSEENLVNLAEILDQGSQTLVVQQQIALAAALITKTCKDETCRKLLASCGVLQSLAARLASFVLATSSAVQVLQGSGNVPCISLQPATARSKLAPILQAIATIISGSNLRTNQFVGLPIFSALFSSRGSTGFAHGRAQSSQTLRRSGPGAPYETTSQPLSGGAPSLAYVGLNTPRKQQRAGHGFSSALEVTPTELFGDVEDEESPLVTWLLQVIRAEGGFTRLMAVWVLTLLHRAGFTSVRRDKGLALLLVPLLVRMLDADYKGPVGALPSFDNSALYTPDLMTIEEAPRVLAILIADNNELQQAASEAGVIKKLSRLLKQSYDPPPAGGSTSFWSPTTTSPNVVLINDTIRSSKLGSPGLSPAIFHVMRVRESVLKAIAAMCSQKDEFRKSIIDNGVVPFVIESLKPFNKTIPGNVSTALEKTSSIGNPTPVLLAACETAKALSRSVSTLRTSLVDAGLATPLYNLLKTQGLDVQVAATAVVCNVVLEFSPMRKAIIEAGILRVVCEHAHSLNSRLRLNSVWALKHLVHSAPNNLKMNCLAELGPGWLKQMISGDAEDFNVLAASSRNVDGITISMGIPNAAGERVDLLNAMGHDIPSPGLVIYDDGYGEEQHHMADNTAASGDTDTDRGQQTSSAPTSTAHTGFLARHRIAESLASETEIAAQARRDEIAIKEQGLDFIRNLICGEGSTEMIDYMFRELGQDNVFDMLANLLRPRAIDAFSRERRTSGGGIKHMPPPTEIIVSVLFIIVHLAASQPRHRQLLISQSELLKQLIPLFGHPSSEVRSCCVWMIINLTWTDDNQDRTNCKLRAVELRRLGVLEKLEDLETDPELDVRERTKTAMHQMSDLLRSSA